MLEFNRVEALYIAEMAKAAEKNIDWITEHAKDIGYEVVSRSCGREFTETDVSILNIQKVLIQDIYDRANDFCGRELWPAKTYAMAQQPCQA